MTARTMTGTAPTTAKSSNCKSNTASRLTAATAARGARPAPSATCSVLVPAIAAGVGRDLICFERAHKGTLPQYL